MFTLKMVYLDGSAAKTRTVEHCSLGGGGGLGNLGHLNSRPIVPGSSTMRWNPPESRINDLKVAAHGRWKALGSISPPGKQLREVSDDERAPAVGRFGWEFQGRVPSSTTAIHLE